MTHSQTIQEKLGYMGRMISGSKSGYCKMYPDREPIFNANIVTSEGKVWYGDLDLVSDKDALQSIANALNEDVCVLREMDARFGSEEDSVETLKSRAVSTISPN